MTVCQKNQQSDIMPNDNLPNDNLPNDNLSNDNLPNDNDHLQKQPTMRQ